MNKLLVTAFVTFTLTSVFAQNVLQKRTAVVLIAGKIKEVSDCRRVFTN